MNKKLSVFLIGILMFFPNCKNRSNWTYDSFFEQNIELIRKNSIKKSDINWDELRKNVLDSIKDFHSDDDVYDAIELILHSINDGHSEFIRPSVPNKLDIDTFSIPFVEHKIIINDIGYIKIPGYMANDSLSHLFALKIRKGLLELDSIKKLSGWIIDLRGNSGGKISSMLLGISPLFADSLVGYALNNSGNFVELYCSNYFSIEGFARDSLIYKSQLQNKNIKTAVLVDNNTVSAGELLAIALKSKKKSKIIGEKTRGKTSFLGLFTFNKSNAKLLLAMMYFCDNKKNVIKGPIVPDIKCLKVESYDLALKWIKE